MLFKVHHGKSFKELNPEYSAIPQFQGLTDTQLVFIALTADYESPLRTLPEKKRRIRAAELAGYTYEKTGKRFNKDGRNAVDGKTESIEGAISAYRSIQYDEQYEMLLAIDKQIQDTLDRAQEDREALCTVVTEKMAKDGSKTTEKKVDAKLLYDITNKANVLTSKLPELRKAKKELQEQIRKDVDVKLPGVQTESDTDDNAQPMSMIDRFNEQGGFNR